MPAVQPCRPPQARGRKQRCNSAVPTTAEMPTPLSAGAPRGQEPSQHTAGNSSNVAGAPHGRALHACTRPGYRFQPAPGPYVLRLENPENTRPAPELRLPTGQSAARSTQTPSRAPSNVDASTARPLPQPARARQQRKRDPQSQGADRQSVPPANPQQRAPHASSQHKARSRTPSGRFNATATHDRQRDQARFSSTITHAPKARSSAMRAARSYTPMKKLIKHHPPRDHALQ